ncbi:hypothetical protein A9Q02_11040 [Candidatus Chloroploca asiatica]|uniref:DUF3368 domain-containing protein n=1 Tax=Candidatus Chloroploca asiatica TaxID=1506545 RepID=A0A2H3KR25_9CHLR|nr:hypothetical protein A9Q02_11040 [Candidatus Chloroploca asiatica]
MVCDTTLLLYLDRIGQIGLLHALFEPVYVPELVCLELDMGRLMRPDTINPGKFNWMLAVSVDHSEQAALPPNRLGPGEQAVIAYARSHVGYVAGLDDRQARLFAERLEVSVVGVIGILIRAKKAGLIVAVQPLLDDLQRCGFHLALDLYEETLKLAGEKDA